MVITTTTHAMARCAAPAIPVAAKPWIDGQSVFVMPTVTLAAAGLTARTRAVPVDPLTPSSPPV